MSKTARHTPGQMLYGAKAIADFLGIDRRQVYSMVDTKRIPYFKVGRIVCASAALLGEWMAARSREAAALSSSKAPEA